MPQQYKDDKGTFNVPNLESISKSSGPSAQYYLSFNYDEGWFNKRATDSIVYVGTVEGGVQPFNVAFYNPYIDKGGYVHLVRLNGGCMSNEIIKSVLGSL